MPLPATPRGQQFLVFTDLDGSLLDAATYSWEAARPALGFLRAEGIPLILVSSKTRAEIDSLRIELEDPAPFIAENGGAIFIPRNYFPTMPEGARTRDGLLVIELGAPYATLRHAIREIEQAVGARLRGFRDMSREEVAARTGLALADAELAMDREYDEPFLIEGPSTLIPAIEREARDRGLTVTRGGRFHHLLGDSDKGRACLHLMEQFRRQMGQPVVSIGLGDSANDLPMLRVVDHPIVVQRPDGSYDPELALSKVTYAAAPGPVGWNEALLRLLDALRQASAPPVPPRRRSVRRPSR